MGGIGTWFWLSSYWLALGAGRLAGLVEETDLGILDGIQEQLWRVGAPETPQMVRIVVNRTDILNKKF